MHILVQLKNGDLADRNGKGKHQSIHGNKASETNIFFIHERDKYQYFFTFFLLDNSNFVSQVMLMNIREDLAL
jgi:hypothetical protein